MRRVFHLSPIVWPGSRFVVQLAGAALVFRRALGLAAAERRRCRRSTRRRWEAWSPSVPTARCGPGATAQSRTLELAARRCDSVGVRHLELNGCLGDHFQQARRVPRTRVSRSAGGCPVIEVRYLRTMINGVPVMATPTEIDIMTAEQLRAVLLEATTENRYRTLVIDITRTRFCDSAAAHTLVAAHNRLVTDGGELRLVVPADGTVRRVVTLARYWRLHRLLRQPGGGRSPGVRWRAHRQSDPSGSNADRHRGKSWSCRCHHCWPSACEIVSGPDRSQFANVLLRAGCLR